MSVQLLDEACAARDHTGPLARFCQEVFRTLPRQDQRRWAEVYLNGLLCVPGRKSVPRIAGTVPGRSADQSLQQFLNQSPWRWEPVRAALAATMTALDRPRAWVFQDVVFPKNGGSSVGVARQRAAPAGRVLNCQLAVAAFLAGQRARSAVDWRLVLPPGWDDAQRRAKVGLPADVRPQPRWQDVLDVLDEVVHDWGLASVPVVVDTPGRSERLRALVSGLENRRMGYLVRLGRAGADEPAARAVPPGGATLNWRQQADGRTVVSRFTVTPLPTRHPAVRAADRPGRRLLTEWRPGGREPAGRWLTNLAGARLPDLIGLVRLANRTGWDAAALGTDFGLTHFEGRSFTGWHHHVTLVSAAHAYRAWQAMGAGDARTHQTPQWTPEVVRQKPGW